MEITILNQGKYMKTRCLFGYTAYIDKQATLQYFEHANRWECTCSHCRNFLALAEKKALPPFVLATLDSLGIPLQKATYVCMLGKENEGFLYQFSYRIAGSYEELPIPLSKSIYCCHEICPHGAPGFPSPHFDLEFFLHLPWILDESPDGEAIKELK